jgi:hypothetical protein
MMIHEIMGTLLPIKHSMHGLQVVLILLVGGLGKSNVCQHLLFS